MTLEELLGSSADEMEKMTEAQVTEFFTPMLPNTRPDKVMEANKDKPKSKGSGRVGTTEEDLKRKKARDIAEQFGFDLGDMGD